MKKIIILLVGILLGATAVFGIDACKQELEQRNKENEVKNYVYEVIDNKYDSKVDVDYYTYEGQNWFGKDVYKVKVHNDKNWSWTTKVYRSTNE